MLDLENLAPLFDGGDIHFVTEDDSLLSWLTGQGLRAMPADDLEAGAPDDVVLALVGWHGELPAAQLQRWGHLLSGSRVLTMPIGAFDPSLGAAAYTIEHTLRSDFVAASARCAQWIDRIHALGLDETLRFTGPRSVVEVTLGPKLSTGTRIQPEVNPGERVSAISYFELEFESLDAGEADFSVDGTMDVTGMLVARGATLPAELLPKWRLAHELLCKMFAATPPEITVVIEDNHFRSIIVDGWEMLPLFAELTNTIYDAKVLEFSIGTNESIIGRADWSHNSFINEGHAGIHVAMGDGTTGPHIDFVCTEVQNVRFT